VEEVTDEPLYRDRVCGIDICKAGMAATIRVPSDENPARRASETREFATTKRGVLALADWLRAWQVPAVVMEATSEYWKPVFYRLEAEGFECVLADARQVKNLPGRPKRDPSDSRWLAACFERGAVRSCFVPDPRGIAGSCSTVASRRSATTPSPFASTAAPSGRSRSTPSSSRSSPPARGP